MQQPAQAATTSDPSFSSHSHKRQPSPAWDGRIIQWRDRARAPRGLAVSALLAISLTSCAGGGASSAESEPSPVSESATPTEVPFKTYSRVELGKILESVRDSNDTRLLVMPDDRLKDALKQAKDIVANSTVEPAACAEFVAGGGAQLEEGAVVSIGASASSNAESVVLLTLVSGVSEDRVKELMAGRAANLKSCGASQATILGQNVEAVTKAPVMEWPLNRPEA